jgi:hypothetical protein
MWDEKWRSERKQYQNYISIPIFYFFIKLKTIILLSFSKVYGANAHLHKNEWVCISITLYIYNG